MAKQKSMKNKGSYAAYKAEGRYAKNKVKKLERLCKQQPNNLPLKKALERAKSGDAAQYSRKASRSKMWTPGSIKFAETIAMTGLDGNLALLEKPIDTKDSREAFGLEWSKAISKVVKANPASFGLSEKIQRHYVSFS